jgi:hypothetical protein
VPRLGCASRPYRDRGLERDRQPSRWEIPLAVAARPWPRSATGSGKAWNRNGRETGDEDLRDGGGDAGFNRDAGACANEQAQRRRALGRTTVDRSMKRPTTPRLKGYRNPSRSMIRGALRGLPILRRSPSREPQGRTASSRSRPPPRRRARRSDERRRLVTWRKAANEGGL